MTEEINPYSPPENKETDNDAWQYREYFEDETEFQESLAMWPVCPECGHRRMTQCSVCHAVGTLFPLADADFWFEEQQPIQQQGQQGPSNQAGHSSCSCHGGSCSCSGHDKFPAESPFSDHPGAGPKPGLPSMDILSQYLPGQKSVEEDSEQSTAANTAGNPVAPSYLDGELQPGLLDLSKPRPLLVGDSDPNPVNISISNAQFAINNLFGKREPNEDDFIAARRSQGERLKLVTCYVCSEPFEPRFPKKCEWCGHAFDDDYPVLVKTDTTLNEENRPGEMTAAHDEAVSPMVYVMFLVLLGLFFALFGYLWYLFR